MEQSREHILQMVSAGTITAEEADRLLSAIEGPPAVEDTSLARPPAVDDLPPLPPIAELRRGWQIPFAGSLLVAAFSLTRLVAGRGRQGILSRLDRGVHGLLFVTAALAALFFLGGREARWLYLKIDQADGRRFTLSLPVPVGLLVWLLRFARRVNTDPALVGQLDAALDFLREMQVEMDSPGGQPVTIDINEEDQRVQIYFL